MPAAWLAHVTNNPHTEVVQETAGGPATLVILLGVALTLATLAALIYLKQKMGEGDDERSG